MQVSFDNKVPIYIQIMDIIKKEIISGKLEGGKKVYSVRELSTKLKVNPNTIQRAYQELEREGITYTKRGMGTFITEDEECIVSLKKNMAKEIMESFLDEMKQLGFSKKEIIAMVSIKMDEEAN